MFDIAAQYKTHCTAHHVGGAAAPQFDDHITRVIKVGLAFSNRLVVAAYTECTIENGIEGEQGKVIFCDRNIPETNY